MEDATGGKEEHGTWRVEIATVNCNVVSPLVAPITERALQGARRLKRRLLNDGGM